MARLEVLKGGIQTSVQDLGRIGHRAQGVPLAGAMDRFALEAANRLVGNPPAAAGLEMLAGGLAVRFLDGAVFALCGGDLGAHIAAEPVALWSAIKVTAGSVLTFAGRQHGSRAYLAVAGGIVVPELLGSRATYLPGGWGGFEGRVLRAGDQLDLGEAGDVPSDRWLPTEYQPPYSTFPVLHCIAGPHAHLFAAETLGRFFASTYRLSPACDRMGYRLDGPTLQTSAPVSLASLGVLPGVVQVPPHGQPILLMADAQTTGGYPVIATVIGPDVALAAQLMPGDQVSFRQVSDSWAVDVARRQRLWLASIQEHDDLIGAPI